MKLGLWLSVWALWESMKFKRPVSKRRRMFPGRRVQQVQSCGGHEQSSLDSATRRQLVALEPAVKCGGAEAIWEWIDL